MAGKLARTGKVGNLVMLIPCRGKHIDRRLKELQRERLVALLHQPTVAHTVERSTLFIYQVVGRDMGQVERNSLLQVMYQRSRRLPRKAVDKVDADARKTCPPQMCHGVERLCRRMTAAQETQVFVGKALYPHAHPVDGKSRQHGGIGRGDIVGIGLESYLAAAVHIDIGRKPLKKPFQQSGRKLRRSASTYINSIDRLAGQFAATQPPLREQGLDITGLTLLPHSRVEIAVNAPCATKRNMKIKSGHQ